MVFADASLTLYALYLASSYTYKLDAYALHTIPSFLSNPFSRSPSFPFLSLSCNHCGGVCIFFTDKVQTH